MKLPPKLLFHPGEGVSGYYDDTREMTLTAGGIFVFGTNLAGRHGKGAALDAKERYGAIYGQAEGFQGRSYGIATKTGDLKIRSLEDIRDSVGTFKWVTDIASLEVGTPQFWYYVTPIGTGLAGYKDEEIAPMFAGTPNCWFPERWRPFLGDQPQYVKRPNAS